MAMVMTMPVRLVSFIAEQEGSLCIATKKKRQSASASASEYSNPSWQHGTKAAASVCLIVWCGL